MKTLNEKIGLKEAAPAVFQIAVEREQNVTLEGLLAHGVTLRAVKGEFSVVRFRTLGGPFAAREGTGWQAVKVKSNFGGVSTLLLEEGRVSGLLRMKR